MASSDTIIRDDMDPTDVFHLLKAKFGLPLPPDEITEQNVGPDAHAYFTQVKFFITFGRHNLAKAIAAFEQFANYQNLPEETLSKASSVRSSQKRQSKIQERRLKAFNHELRTQVLIFQRNGGSIATQGSSRQSITSLPLERHNVTDRSSSYRASTQVPDRHIQRVLEWQTRNLSAADSSDYTYTRPLREGIILEAGEAELAGDPEVEHSVDNDDEINEAFPDYVEEPTEIDAVVDESGLLPVGITNMPGGFPESTSSRSEKQSHSIKQASSRHPRPAQPIRPPHPPVHSPPSKRVTSKNYNWGTYIPPDIDATKPPATSSSMKPPAPSSSNPQVFASKPVASSSSSMNRASDPDEEKKRKRAVTARPAHEQLTQQPKDSSPERPAKRHSPRTYRVQPPNPDAIGFSQRQKIQDSNSDLVENERHSSTSDLRRDESFSTAASQRTSFGFQPSFDTTQPTSFNSTMEGKIASVEIQDEETDFQGLTPSMLPPAKPASSRKQERGVSRDAQGSVSSSSSSMKSRTIVRQRQYSPPSAQLVRESKAASSRSSYSIGASTERGMMELDAPAPPVNSTPRSTHDPLLLHRELPALLADKSTPSISGLPLNISSRKAPGVSSQTLAKPNSAKGPVVNVPLETLGIIPAGRAAKYVLYDTLENEPFPGDFSEILDDLRTPFWLKYEITRVTLGTSAKRSPTIGEEIQRLVRRIHRSEPTSYEYAKQAFHQTFQSYVSEEAYVTHKGISGREVFETIRTSEKGWDDRLQLTAELKFDRADNATSTRRICKPTIRLQPLQIESKSCRFSRRFGSDRFLVLRVPKLSKMLGVDSGDYTKIIDELLVESGFKLLSRKWRLIYFRESSNSSGKRERNNKKSRDWHILVLFAEEGVGLDAVDVRQATEWFISVKDNLKQTECKFWARIKLGFSTTQPTVVFDKLQYIDDIKVGPNCLTDGCGLVSPAVLRRVKTDLELSYVPSAVQARIGPAKGLFVADPSVPLDSDELWIKIRGDQKKFEIRSDDIAHRTLDVNGVSSPLSPATLNRQFLPILLQNGVPYEIFAELLREDIRREIGDLLESGRLEDPIYLRGYLDKIRLQASRRGIETLPTKGRVPSGLPERVAFRLECGFTLKDPLLRKDFLEILKDYCDELEKRMHIAVPQSCTALIVADPSLKLKKGEVYLRFSEPRNFIDAKTMLPTDVLIGDVLVGRNPAHFACDIQRVTAVDVPELRHLTDVLVFSADAETCDRSLADYLSGGDYDGDRVWTCWDPRVVDPYVNSEDGPQNVDIEDYIKKEKTTMRSRFSARRREEVDAWTDYVKGRVKSIMQDDRLGLCTSFYDRLVYKTWLETPGGVNHPKAKELAALCGILVDAPKQGYEIYPDNWEVFHQRYRNFPPPLYSSAESRNNHAGKKSEFPLDKLRFRVASAEIDSLMDQLKEKLPAEESKDTDVVGYYDKFDNYWRGTLEAQSKSGQGSKYRSAHAVVKNLSHLNKELESLKDKWRSHFEFVAVNGTEDETMRTKKQNFVEECLTKYTNILPELDNPNAPPTDLIEEWHRFGTEPLSEWSKIRAAALYRKCYADNFFPWAMAGPEIGLIKLLAVSPDPSRAIRFMREDVYLSLKTKASAMSKGEDNIWIDATMDDPHDVDDIDCDA
ncbi:hypothetical protein Dda_4256 [Drechslerella dactyloides]|uniref:RDRP core domain-containing protein n=1 Tax=Drechslerella dactyloides TaxID=74499 RepID=A0AAD6J3R3_DREDA|nr:hypothetical protein Dda_4256 [Drechslerella dactyloides]